MFDKTLIEAYLYIQGLNFLVNIIVIIVLMIIAIIFISIKEYSFKKNFEKKKRKYNKNRK